MSYRLQLRMVLYNAPTGNNSLTNSIPGRVYEDDFIEINYLRLTEVKEVVGTYLLTKLRLTHERRKEMQRGGLYKEHTNQFCLRLPRSQLGVSDGNCKLLLCLPESVGKEIQQAKSQDDEAFRDMFTPCLLEAYTGISMYKHDNCIDTMLDVTLSAQGGEMIAALLMDITQHPSL